MWFETKADIQNDLIRLSALNLPSPSTVIDFDAPTSQVGDIKGTKTKGMLELINQKFMIIFCHIYFAAELILCLKKLL